MSISPFISDCIDDLVLLTVLCNVAYDILVQVGDKTNGNLIIVIKYTYVMFNIYIISASALQ